MDHFPVVVKIEGREMRVREREKKKGGRDGPQFQKMRRTLSLSRRVAQLVAR